MIRTVLWMDVKKNIGKSEQEDYIDLQPILENLYMDPEKFYRPIKKVEVRYV